MAFVCLIIGRDTATFMFHCLVAMVVPTPEVPGPSWKARVLQFGVASTYTMKNEDLIKKLFKTFV